MRFMLDTNICIHLIQRRPPGVVERFALLRGGNVVMSIITLAELRHGVECDPLTKVFAEHALSLLLSFIPAVAFDNDAATHYGVLAAAVRDRKRDALDRLIAAHTLSLSVTLVTTNLADFRGYPGFSVENWINTQTATSFESEGC